MTLLGMCTEPAPPDYTIRTFDLYLAELAWNGEPGPDELVGNIVTGSLDDDTEVFDAFDSLGAIDEPVLGQIRSGVRLGFSTDEITCQNLKRILNVVPALAVGADRFLLDPVARGLLYRVTLEHTMPCGTLVMVRLHRASVTNRASWLFSPDTVHTLTIELRALPADGLIGRFGYIEIRPAACAES